MQMHTLLLVVLLFCTSNVLFVDGATNTYSVTFAKPDTWSLVQGKVDNYVATAQIQRSINATGWSTLDVETNAQEEDYAQAFGAGYIEGALTTNEIYDLWNTQLEYLYNGTMDDDVVEWLLKNDQWVRQQVANCSTFSTSECDYWYQVSLVIAQLDGMVLGYNQNCDPSKQLTYPVFLYLNAQDDIDDIQTALNTSLFYDSGIWEQHIKQRMQGDHCSALLKYSETEKQIYQAHVTWDVFANMLRIFKHYNFAFSHPSTAATRVSYSGTPGFLASGDDFFITNQGLVVTDTTNSVYNNSWGLVVTETTNSVYNNSLYLFVQPTTVLYWIRAIVANRMSPNGSMWVQTFAKYNSGTYNNQWQIMDTKLFKSGDTIQAGTFYLLEQIPGYVESGDLSSVLASAGYFASYNVPYFPMIYNLSGYLPLYQQYGDGYSYEECTRAKIFRRDQGKVQTLQDMQAIMRSNGYETDPYCLDDPCNCISPRCDLNATDPWPYGGIDCKISSTLMAQTMLASAVSGPTTEDLPPFSWADFDWVPHYGEPTLFNFSFQQMQPAQF